ncbi:Chromate transport protein [Clostridiales bacterium CHKCI001]|nr:Chromate transport protein [Clostridiales bacterium CHKCI001]
MEVLIILLISFLQIGLFSIGGGYATIPLIQEQVVNLHSWLSIQEFTDIITISQMTPGPLAVNTSTFVGIRIAGILGAVVATFGCVFSGFVISLILYRFFDKYRSAETVLNILKGLKSCSVGLIAASASTILMIAFFGTSTLDVAAFQWNLFAIGIFVTALILLRKLHLNPILVMILSGVAGYFIYA